MIKQRTYRLIETKNVFIITVIVLVLTILAVYFFGLGSHHTFFHNSIVSTTILSAAFFLFITIGLFQGTKLRDNLGKVIDRYKPVDTSGVGDWSGVDFVPVEAGDGIAGIIISIFSWIVLAVGLAVALWIFSNVFVVVFLSFMAMLYWIFFRALRLVFRNSNKSKGNILESVKWGMTYTLLYNFWIYGIFILINALKK
ncbi:MAG: hypothetical protein JSS79_12320 [Bacteroidetes bacterium]|nr:hypothetical protein [Bacteroidota bacterium]